MKAENRIPDVPTPLSTEDINTIIETQLEAWPLARENFFRLAECSRKPLELGALKGAAQYNPARIRSTGAAVDRKSIENRPCFLCRKNRPKEQIAIPWMKGWELLVNPYPILPVHFTVASTRHTPQKQIPFETVQMVSAAPDLALFFNGAKAGASAPDHLHLQGVLKSELPLLRLAESLLPADRKSMLFSDETGLDLPFHFVAATISPGMEGSLMLLKLLCTPGLDAETGKLDTDLRNAFFWIGDDGLLRGLVVPRRAHRPACYDLPEGERMVISPGAIDMAGLMIVPRKEDFDRLDADTAARIYAEVAFADRIPEKIKEHVNAL